VKCDIEPFSQLSAERLVIEYLHCD